MKILLILLVAGTFALKADDANPATPSTPATTNAAPLAPPAPIDEAIVAHQGYPSARYESLWTKSPFSVETAEAAEESPDYSLVGIAEFDGIAYASLIEKQNQNHLLISSDKANNGLTLGSITKGKDGGDTYAVVNKDGQSLTLKLEQLTLPAGMPPTMPNAVVPMPGGMTPQIPMPGAGGNIGGMPGSTPSVRPLIRIHRPMIHVPPRPLPAEQAAPAAGAANVPPPPTAQ